MNKPYFRFLLSDGNEGHAAKNLKLSFHWNAHIFSSTLVFFMDLREKYFSVLNAIMTTLWQRQAMSKGRLTRTVAVAVITAAITIDRKRMDMFIISETSAVITAVVLRPWSWPSWLPSWLCRYSPYVWIGLKANAARSGERNLWRSQHGAQIRFHSPLEPTRYNSHSTSCLASATKPVRFTFRVTRGLLLIHDPQLDKPMPLYVHNWLNTITHQSEFGAIWAALFHYLKRMITSIVYLNIFNWVWV